MTPHAIEATGLCYSYPDGTPALRDISVRIAAGEKAGLVGGNGAGKSTFLLHLAACLLPGGGTLRIAGIPLERPNTRAIRRHAGLVFQDPDDQLFMPTVAEDVAFGPRNHGLSAPDVAQAVSHALRDVGLEHLRDRPPHRLSGGEKRLAAMAAVLAMQPAILAMDEPSSNLDPRARRRLIRWLQGFPRTLVLASHDLELVVETCPRVLVLDRGVLVAEGPTHLVLGNEALMERHGLESPHILRHLHPH